MIEFTFNDSRDSLSLGGGGQNAKAQQFVLCCCESFLCQVQVARLPHPAAAFCLATTKDRAVLDDRQNVLTRQT